MNIKKQEGISWKNARLHENYSEDKSRKCIGSHWIPLHEQLDLRRCTLCNRVLRFDGLKNHFKLFHPREEFQDNEIRDTYKLLKSRSVAYGAPHSIPTKFSSKLIEICDNQDDFRELRTSEPPMVVGVKKLASSEEYLFKNPRKKRKMALYKSMFSSGKPFKKHLIHPQSKTKIVKKNPSYTVKEINNMCEHQCGYGSWWQAQVLSRRRDREVHLR